MSKVVPFSLFTEFDIDLFRSGKHFKLYEKFGAHVIEVDGVKGCYFAVWAPGASLVTVIGNWNHWNGDEHPLNVRWDSSGIWEGFIPGIGHGEAYKYRVTSNVTGGVKDKADPYARWAETPPFTASITFDHTYQWGDKKWMKNRASHNALDAPYSVYEIHFGSWKKKDDNKSLTYGEMADQLCEYLVYMGYTHVEFLPIMEYPYEPSWGYQVSGYFAPTSRHGAPEDFKYLVDRLHQAGIGVILDWVPAHFPADEFSLAQFDGTHLYEHPDIRKGYHPDWKSLIFNYERNEVRSFLISSAIFWLDQYHIDGLRVDAVASMLYLDYSREDGEWEPNEYGGRENLAAVSFLRDFNEAAYGFYPDIQTIAEESTSFPMISKPTWMGGLGFGMKWMMGWMHDTLEYFKKETIYRKYHQNNITFSLAYAFTENFMLPLSHDEVVHGKNSIVYRMPGDEWQKFANLRLLYSLMFTHPGSKLLFMGNDFGQTSEWNFEESLQWFLVEYAPHKGTQLLIKELNRLYRNEKALYQYNYSIEGWEWIDFSDAENSVMVFMRKSDNEKDTLICVANLTEVAREKYRIGLPSKGTYKKIFDSDAEQYFGSNYNSVSKYKSDDEPWQHRAQSMEVKLSPLALQIFKKA